MLMVMRWGTISLLRWLEVIGQLESQSLPLHARDAREH